MEKHTCSSCVRESEDDLHRPQGSITGDHLEGQWHLKGSSCNPSNLNRVSVLMIIWYAGSRLSWSELAVYSGCWGWRQSGEEQTQCPCRAVRFVRAGASGAGEYGLTSLIVPKVSTSRRTTQGCAISIWSVLNVGLCLPYLLITVSWHDHHGWWCWCWSDRPWFSELSMKKGL